MKTIFESFKAWINESESIQRLDAIEESYTEAYEFDHITSKQLALIDSLCIDKKIKLEHNLG